MPDPIDDRLRRLIAAGLRLALETVRPDATLLEDLGADSLDWIELLGEIEREFGVVIEDADAERMHQVRDLSELVRRRARAASRSGQEFEGAYP